MVGQVAVKPVVGGGGGRGGGAPLPADDTAADVVRTQVRARSGDGTGRDWCM